MGMQRIKVLHMVGLTQGYGVERQLLDHLALSSEQPNEIEHHVCALKISEDILRELEQLKIPYIKNNLRSLGKIYQFRRYVQQNNIEILHAHNLLRYPIRTRIIPKLSGIPVVLEHEHGMIWNMGFSPLVRITNGLANMNICNSGAAKIMLKNKLDIDARVVHNGIKMPDTSSSGKNYNEIVKELKIEEHDHVVGFVGRLNTPKGVHAFIRMVQIIKQTMNNVKFLIVGDGPMYKELEQFAEQLGVRNDILFMGFRSDVRAIMSRLDVMVVPSIREPFGNVVIEAALARKVVVASCVDGIAETIIDGETGFLIDCTEPAPQRTKRGISRLPKCVVDGRSGQLRQPMLPNSKMMAEKVMMCLENPLRRKEIGDNAFIRATQHFSLERYRADLDKLYREMSGSNRL